MESLVSSAIVKKKLFFCVKLALIICLAIAPQVHGHTSHRDKLEDRILATKTKPKSKPKNTKGMIALACKATRFPDVCQSSLSSSPIAITDSSQSQDVVAGAIQVAFDGEKQSYNLSRTLLGMSGGNPNLTAAAAQCEYLLRRGIVLFSKSQQKKLSSAPEAEDVQAWMSAVLTYENDCHSALSYVNETHFVGQIMAQIDGVITLTSNALSMVDAYSAFGSNMAQWKPPQRGGFSRAKYDMDWVSSSSSRDQHLYEKKVRANDFEPSVVVSKDGKGDYSSVQAAVDGAPENSGDRYIIYIKEGVYNEIVNIPFTKTFLMFVGDGKGRTVITGDRNVQIAGITTYNSPTAGIDGDGFIGRDITFVNTAGPDNHQAVAARVDSDFSVFVNCSFLGYQDTLYTHSLRQFYRDCEIQGSVDFIFGNSAAVFQDCDIIIREGRAAASQSMVTAQGRTDPAETTGLVFQNCSITGTQEYMDGFHQNPKKHQAYLGRPWKLYSRTIFMNTYLGELIRPEGWFPWNGDFALSTLFYGEYDNYGPGAGTSGRVPWSTQLTSAQAQSYSVSKFIQGDEWLPAAHVPFNT